MCPSKKMNESRLRRRVIDVHCHLGKYSPVYIPRSKPDDMIRVMDAIGIEAACISSFAAIGPDWEVGNSMVAEAVSQYPQRFIGYGVINPNYPGHIHDELDRCFDVLGLQAIKLHPVWHDYPIDGPNYTPVFEYAESHRLTILSHTWGNSDFLAGAASSYPNINFVVAHAGGWNGKAISSSKLIEYKILATAKNYGNIYLDLAASLVYFGALERLVKLVGAEKILFGSDFPLHNLGYQLGRVLFAKISRKEKNAILWENAQKLLWT